MKQLSYRAFMVLCFIALLGGGLGWGGGYYDRYLPKTNCPKILLCRSKLVENEIPVEEHDLVMDYLATEDGVILCGEEN